MNRMIALFTAFAFIAVPLGAAWASTQSGSNALWVELCSSGQFIKLDLGDSKDEPPLPKHKSQACHAVCCRDGDVKDDEKSKDRPQSL